MCVARVQRWEVILHKGLICHTPMDLCTLLYYSSAGESEERSGNKLTTVYERPRGRRLQPEHVSRGGEEDSHNTSTSHGRDVSICHPLQVAHSLGTKLCCKLEKTAICNDRALLEGGGCSGPRKLTLTNPSL